MIWKNIAKIAAVVSTIATLIVLILVIVYLLTPKTVVPESISKQLISSLFVPSGVDVRAARRTVKYDNSIKLLSYVVSFDASQLTISEQATPDSFNDVPAVYDKMVQSMAGYSSFDSPQGKVDLTLPPNNGGEQTAVMNSKGTLMFVKASHKLSSDQWKQFFRSLSIQN